MRRFLAAAAVAVCALVLGAGAAGAAPTDATSQVTASSDQSNIDRDW